MTETIGSCIQTLSQLPFHHFLLFPEPFHGQLTVVVKYTHPRKRTSLWESATATGEKDDMEKDFRSQAADSRLVKS